MKFKHLLKYKQKKSFDYFYLSNTKQEKNLFIFSIRELYFHNQTI